MATDSELASLAQDAVDPLNGGDYGNPIPPTPTAGTLGLDLTGIGTPEQPVPVQAPLPIASGPMDDGLAQPAAQISDLEPPRPRPNAPTTLNPAGALQAMGAARDAAYGAADAKAAEAGPRREAVPGEARGGAGGERNRELA